MANHSPRVKSADRVMEILELFTSEREEYSLSEISKILEMPPSSTYLILQNMLSREFLETDKSGKMFSIGNKIFEIRNKYMRNTGLTMEFEKVGQKIAEDLNEGVMLGIRGGDQLVYLSQKNPPDPRRFAIQLAQTLPLYASASGKMILSSYPEEVIKKIYPNEELQPLTGKTIRTVTELLRELETIRIEGAAYNRGESVEGVSCVSGPIYNLTGSVIASISVSIPDFRKTEEVWAKAKELVLQGSKELSYRVYGHN